MKRRALERPIRTDASTRIGLGHLVRCRTLATALRDQGATVRFICRAHPGHQFTALRADGWGLAALPAPPIQEDVADGDYAAWLGVPQAQDAAETIAALAADRPDWLIVDHYGLDADWEWHLRPHIGLILYLGHQDEVDLARLQRALTELVVDATSRAALSKAGTDLIDGLGTQRVVLNMQ